MKHVTILIILLISLLSLNSCQNISELNKSSLILQYYQGPYQWAGITLGESTKEETKVLLTNIAEVKEETLYEGKRFEGIDSALCVDFQEGFRESSICVWFIDNKAQVLEFFGGSLELSEIIDNIGEVEQFAALIIQEESTYIRYFGVSLKSGFIVLGSPNISSNVLGVRQVIIDSDDEFHVDLMSPDIFDLLLDISMGKEIGKYLIEKGGFQDWHGYGEYEVQKPDILN